jgi:hypothetical protein
MYTCFEYDNINEYYAAVGAIFAAYPNDYSPRFDSIEEFLADNAYDKKYSILGIYRHDMSIVLMDYKDWNEISDKNIKGEFDEEPMLFTGFKELQDFITTLVEETYQIEDSSGSLVILNEDYTAVVKEDGVQVGCQFFEQQQIQQLFDKCKESGLVR